MAEIRAVVGKEALQTSESAFHTPTPNPPKSSPPTPKPPPADSVQGRRQILTPTHFTSVCFSRLSLEVTRAELVSLLPDSFAIVSGCCYAVTCRLVADGYSEASWERCSRCKGTLSRVGIYRSAPCRAV